VRFAIDPRPMDPERLLAGRTPAEKNGLVTTLGVPLRS
jgi:hypothetical protein